MLILERDRTLTDVERKLLEFNVESYLPNYEPYAIRAVAHIPRSYAHLTAVGNRMAAQHIASGILPQIRQQLAFRSGAK